MADGSRPWLRYEIEPVPAGPLPADLIRGDQGWGMHVVVCCDRFPSMSQTFVTSEVMGLERRGHQVTVVAEVVDRGRLSLLPGGGPSGGVLALSPDVPSPVRESPSPGLRLKDALRGLPGFLIRSKSAWRYARYGHRRAGLLAAQAYAVSSGIGDVDLVHAHLGPKALWARAIALRHNAPLAVTFHGADATSYPREFGWEAYRVLLDHPTATIIAHSPLVARLLKDSLAVRVLKVPLGVDTSLFAPREGSGRLGPQGSAPRLVFVGRLIPRKGVRIAVEALALLSRGSDVEGHQATLQIVGEGPERKSIDTIADVLGVSDRIRCHGAQAPAEVARVLREGDLLLVPSLGEVDGSEEAFGVVCLEAQACGLLVVGTLSGGLPEAIAPPVGGLCAPQHSPAAIALAATKILHDPQLRSRSEAARSRVLDHHNLDRYLGGYERVFEAMLSGRSVEGPGFDDAQSGESPGATSASVVVDGALGSLPAYVQGRDVTEIRRQPSHRYPSHAATARRWVSLTMDALETDGGAAEPEDAQVLLDLDGARACEVMSSLATYRRLLGPEGFALIAVLGDEKQAERLRRALEPSFRRAHLMDRLFLPFPPPAGWTIGRRYLLCAL